LGRSGMADEITTEAMVMSPKQEKVAENVSSFVAKQTMPIFPRKLL